MYSRIVHGTACSGIDFFWGGRRNGAGSAKGKSSGASGGVEPARGSMPEERAASKRMVCGTGDPGIHVL